MRPGALWTSVRRVFPERQILVRDTGRIRCFKLGTLPQLGVIAAVAGCVLWALLSTAAYLDGAAKLASKEDEIAQRAAELDGLKASYQAAFGRLDEFQSIFAGITCEITDIQDSLLRIAERNVVTGKRGIAGTMPRLDADANGCRVIANAAQPAAATPASGDTRRIVGSLKDDGANEQEVLRRRVTQLEEALEKLRASHSAFLQNTADIAALRIGEMEKALAAVGVNAKSLSTEADRRPTDGTSRVSPYGRGGPFIAAPPGTKLGGSFNPVALFNNHADRLDTLTTALRSLPLGEPLADYEVTSPFGARNDPINNLTGIHEGVDLGAPTGTPVRATGEGVISSAGWRDRYGIMVEVDHGMGLRTRYAHLSKSLVAVGQHVSRGATIGFVGETGRTTGPHLHYEVRMADQATNPMKFITAGQNVLKSQ